MKWALSTHQTQTGHKWMKAERGREIECFAWVEIFEPQHFEIVIDVMAVGNLALKRREEYDGLIMLMCDIDARSTIRWLRVSKQEPRCDEKRTHTKILAITSKFTRKCWRITKLTCSACKHHPQARRSTRLVRCKQNKQFQLPDVWFHCAAGIWQSHSIYEKQRKSQTIRRMRYTHTNTHAA